MKQLTWPTALLVGAALAATAAAGTLVVERQLGMTPVHSFLPAGEPWDPNTVTDTWVADLTPVTFAMADYDWLELRLVTPPETEIRVDHACFVFPRIKLGSGEMYFSLPATLELLGPSAGSPSMSAPSVMSNSSGNLLYGVASSQESGDRWAFGGLSLTVDLRTMGSGARTYPIHDANIELRYSIYGPADDPGSFSEMVPLRPWLRPMPLTSLLGSPQPVGSGVTVTDMSAGNLSAEVWSRCYTDGQGTYAYLYQVHNTGVDGNAPVELFGLWPFTGAGDDTWFGYLTDGIPAEFDAGAAVLPSADLHVEQLSSGPQISFYHLLRDGDAIAPGEHGPVLYVLSDLPPDRIDGSLSAAGSAATGRVLGPVPEPAAACLLAIGALALTARRRRR